MEVFILPLLISSLPLSLDLKTPTNNLVMLFCLIIFFSILLIFFVPVFPLR